MADNKPLSRMTRDELNAYATELGVENPEGMSNSDEVRAAIESASGPNAPEGSTLVGDSNPDVPPLDDDVQNTNVLASPSTFVAETDDDAPDETSPDVSVPGGVYIVGGKRVNANGEEIE